MGRLKNLAGMTFGRLTVAHRATINDGSFAVWVCRCECGKNASVRSGHLLSGRTASCGCLMREAAAAARTTHGGFGTPTYKSWDSMIQRCTNPRNKNFSSYGGAGITVCDAWKSFDGFLLDMGIRPDGKTLDRHPNMSGNYEPSNCRWATAIEQRRNQRRHLVTSSIQP